MFWGDDNDEEIEIADLTLSEARETLNKQIEGSTDIDTKAAKLLRINTVILGIVISGLSFVLSDSSIQLKGDGFNGLTIIGLVLLLGSIAFAALTYTASDLYVGVSQSDISELIDGGYSELSNKESLAKVMGKWIDFNSDTITISAFYFTTTTTLLVWSLSFLALGIADALSNSVGIWTLSLIVAILLIFTYVSEWFNQLHRYWTVVEPVERLKSICCWRD
ncbi:hypothetical protein [Halanaeroarchaeum sp. HSR-CO]|uniref:hypothetical protein n=1 Tax=Halanaeroarchaeum sp. HSR-CO TaxID=2866382 RepID=UPI00217D46B7|nr:hypothetical protein [Halanaeroarchaeum sp. HSR-CO]